MPDLARVTARRTVLPYKDTRGNTVTVHDGDIYLNARKLGPIDALDLCAALGRAVTDIADQRIAALTSTTPNHTPTEGA